MNVQKCSMKAEHHLLNKLWNILYSGKAGNRVSKDPQVKELLYRTYQLIRQPEPDFEQMWERICRQTIQSDRRLRLRCCWIRGIAAGIILIVGITSFLYMVGYPNQQDQIAMSPVVRLTLSDGSVVNLTEKANTNLGIEHIFVNHEGDKSVLTYLMEEEKDTLLKYNTIEVPIAADYRLVLSDGTKVYLNSDSRLKYPIAFTGQERRVYLEGEGFFEVAKNPGQPFVVVVRDMEVEALGTIFNINAYTDQGDIRTTLVQGKVAVRGNHSNVILLPGKQAIYNQGGVRVQDANVQENIAWKDGLFVFNAMSLDDIMKQMKRWYGVEVIFLSEHCKHFTFTGMIDKSLPLSETFQVIEKTVDIHFKMQDKTVIIN